MSVSRPLSKGRRRRDGPPHHPGRHLCSSRHIEKPKSTTAAEVLKEMNPSLQLEAHRYKVRVAPRQGPVRRASTGATPPCHFCSFSLPASSPGWPRDGKNSLRRRLFPGPGRGGQRAGQCRCAPLHGQPLRGESQASARVWHHGHQGPRAGGWRRRQVRMIMPSKVNLRASPASHCFSVCADCGAALDRVLRKPARPARGAGALLHLKVISCDD